MARRKLFSQLAARFFSQSNSENSDFPIDESAPHALLLHHSQKPADVQFQRESFEGLGTIELPAGGNWERRNQLLWNNDWTATIVIQAQLDGMAGLEREYMHSYNNQNIKAAPAWRRGPEKLGMLSGLRVGSTQGAFNNGTAMRTRDYIFFGAEETVILQMRIAEAHAAHLALVIDYIAGSFVAA